MKKILILLLILATTDAMSQGRKIEFTEYDLDNGLHVILHQDNTTPIVTVSVLYHVGSKNEPPGRTGFAHFFEHLMFEGSPNIGRGEYFKIIQGAGGQLNANTTNDRTYYYQTLPSNQLELGLYMESERMLHAKIDSAGIATQKEVVKEEKRQRIDNQPYGSILENMFKYAFEGTNYEWTPIGSFEDIDAATEQDFVDFYETFYVPNNATLAIAGDIDIPQAKKLVKKYFGEIKRGTKDIPRPDIQVKEMDDEVRETVFDNIQLPAVVHAYRIPEQGTKDSYALTMLTTLLSGGESSRFQKAIVDEQQLAVAVQAFPFTMEDAGLFGFFGLANMGTSPEDLEASIEAEMERVKNELISEKEFQKLQNQVENQFVRQNGSVQGLAENLANYHVYFGSADLVNTELERYREVTREDIQRVAKQYLTKDNRVVLTYLSKSAQKQPDSETLKKEGN